MLEILTRQSRFVTVVYKDGYIVEANCWLSLDAPYTVNVRGKGKTVEEAATDCFKKLEMLKYLGK